MALAFAVLQVAVMWFFPVVLWVVLTRRLRVSWRYVGLGCATWLTAAPFIVGVPLAAAAIFGQKPLVWGIALSVAAGIAEETSRYVYYRRSAAMRDPHNWNIAVVAGAAHGGMESIVLGIQALAGVIVVFFMPNLLPASVRGMQPVALDYALGAGSRILLIVVHIGFTMLVWQAVSRKQIGLYVAAMLLHIGIDLVAFTQPILLPGYDWISWSLIIAVFAGALWLIRRNRPHVQQDEPATSPLIHA